MNKFEFIKDKINFLETLEKYIGPLQQCGEYNWTADGDICPIHGGHGSFRIKHDDEGSFINCFGDTCAIEQPVDIIEFVRIYKELETASQAVDQIAKDFDIVMPRAEQHPMQELYNAAALYFQRKLELDLTAYPCLGDRTPLDFQKDSRGHKESTVKLVGVGWSDGCLHRALANDFTEDELLASGLVRKQGSSLRDLFPKNAFIYPQKCNGRISRFTMKNMGSSSHFQQNKRCWINGIQFMEYGFGNEVAIVEGENDLASLVDYGWKGKILCSNGSLSKSQLEYLQEHPANYHTYWDADGAGDKYAHKVWNAFSSGLISEVDQYSIPEEDGDIDSYLQSGKKLEDLTAQQRPDVNQQRMNLIRDGDGDIIDNGGFYSIRVVDKEGNISYKAISDFTIELLYVKVLGDERSRVIRIHRKNGKSSRPIIVNSEAKVSIRHFKILAANAIDAKFSGKEEELESMWDFVYSSQKEAIVDVPPIIGKLEDDGWLLGNRYLGPEKDIEGDENNIMWFDKEHAYGVSPKSLMATLGSTRTSSDMPVMSKHDDIQTLIENFTINLAAVMKSPGAALMMVGWLRSCAYSMDMFYDAGVKFFPFLLLSGRHGKGKSTVVNWMLSVFDMADKGTTTVGQLKTGVGIERKLAYYRSLPYCIDELRADRMASEYSKTWRGWYNRSSRIKGTRKTEEAIQVPFNACLMFSGQDTFTDAAMRSRTIPLKFPRNAGDQEAFMWMEDNIEDLPSIGYHWIKESMNVEIEEVKNVYDEFRNDLSDRAPPGISSRSVSNFAYVGVFAAELAAKCFPDYDYGQYMLTNMKYEHIEAEEDDMVNAFWESIAGLQVGENPALNSNHLVVHDKNTLYMWYAEVFSIVMNNARGSTRETFSKGAIRDALKDEPYFKGFVQTRLVGNTQRRCIAIDRSAISPELESIFTQAESNY